MKTLEDYRFEPGEKIEGDAVFEGKHRYSLSRTWNRQLPRVMWIMLNPSRADHIDNDPTIRKCMGFSKGLGFGGMEVVNLFSYIATDPEDLKMTIDKKGLPYAIGKKNDHYIKKLAKDVDLIILGWGNHAKGFNRSKIVGDMLSGKDIRALRLNKTGYPKHPLYEAYLNIQTLEDLVSLEEKEII